MHAHGAAQYLLQNDPRRLWRRLVVIAFEDFGPCSGDLLASICSVASNVAWRKKNGGEQKALAFVIEQLLTQPRDRITDDCYMAALAEVERGSAINCTREVSPILRKAIQDAVRVVETCEQVVYPQKFRAIVAARCNAKLVKRLEQGAITQEAMAVLQQGYRTSRCLLPVIAAVFGDIREVRQATARVNSVPAVITIGGVPSYALDGYTRIGKATLAMALRRMPGLAKATQGIQSPAGRNKALCALLFAAEGGICTSELHDPLRAELKKVALCGWAGMQPEELDAAIGLMTDAIPALNEIRAQFAPELIQPRQMELWNGQ